MTSYIASRHSALNVIELRRYTLYPHKRDVLIELFDREFVETQEAVGMAVIGQFREAGTPDEFVWLRGFADMTAREKGLNAFYGGPVWQRHRDAANATMIDSDNVLLLRPAWLGAGLPFESDRRAAQGAIAIPDGLIVTTIMYLEAPVTQALLDECRTRIAALIEHSGALMQGWYVTESSENNFPRLPVRENEPVLVNLALFASMADATAHERSAQLQSVLASLLHGLHTKNVEQLRLTPTARSATHA
jgi:hypothetical protein